ncbi:hypothetical protein [Nocardioides aquiterrae]
MALSIRQPYLWAICRGGKDVENRANKRGQEAARKQFLPASGRTVLLHASSRWEGEEAFRVVRHRTGLDVTAGGPRADTAWFGDGGFVATARVEAIHTADACYDPLSGRMCSRWAEENAAHLVLGEVRVLHRPVPYRGALGLFKVEDATVLSQIRRQLA